MPEPRRTRRSRRRRTAHPAVILLALLVGAAALLPFLWMVSTSLMERDEVFQEPSPILPSEARWSNYPQALTAQPFERFFLNTAILACFTVLGQVITAALGGYAFARYRFAGRGPLFLVYLSTLMVPAVVLLVPRFLLVDAFGGIDTLAGLVSTELVSVSAIFLMRQFFVSIPRDMEEAARVDGAGEWTIFWRVALPLARPVLATLALFAFIDAWKSFLWPLIVTRSLERQVIEVGISGFQGLYFANWPYQMAVAVTALLPVLIVFLFTQRYLVRGIQLTGLR
jgi:multiple sugar transport system permease protein